jgi:type IV secretory pathway VirB4 component
MEKGVYKSGFSTAHSSYDADLEDAVFCFLISVENIYAVARRLFKLGHILGAYLSDDTVKLVHYLGFVLSLFELILGGKVSPGEQSAIDRCVHNVYREYFKDPRPERMPVLGDIYRELLALDMPDAKYVAAALSIYVDGTLDLFNHRTNVDIGNRVVCYDIRKLGKQLKKLGMLVVQDQVWGRVTANREKGKTTRYYMDEFHLLLREEQTAAYSIEIWKRFRKWGGIPTGITQNVKDFLESRGVSNILENSDFILMLSQAAEDRRILSERLGISEAQKKHIKDSGEGEGLISCGNIIVPFEDHFPTDTDLYRILTTKLTEVAEREA